MTPKERERLVNILARTSSTYDGEALAAVRKANELLKRHRLSWQEFLGDAGSRSHRAEAGRQETAAGFDGQSSAWAEEPDHPPGWGGDIFGDTPASAPYTISRPKKLAGRLRLFLASIAWPLRLLLGPLTVAGYCAAWLLESEDAGDVLGRSLTTALAVSAVAVIYGAFAIALIQMVQEDV
jgi:hypothetical protein